MDTSTSNTLVEGLPWKRTLSMLWFQTFFYEVVYLETNCRFEFFVLVLKLVCEFLLMLFPNYSFKIKIYPHQKYLCTSHMIHMQWCRCSVCLLWPWDSPILIGDGCESMRVLKSSEFLNICQNTLAFIYI